MKLIRFLLFPFAILYDLITTIRNYFFDIGVLKSTSFPIPVIAVGNLSVGGTGKTPQIEYLIRLLKDDYKVSVLSRGYKRKTKGFQILNKTHTAEDVGDEPLQFFLKFKEITVAVDANRTEGIQRLLKEVKPDVILLDDAYQHRKVKAGYYILLTKFNELYVNDFILPTGNLRESRRGANRASMVIVTKCPNSLKEVDKQTIAKKLNLHSNQELFFTRIAYNNQLLGSIENLTIEELKGKKVVLVTGIANPSSLLSYLDECNINYEHLKFPDHHHFSEQDLFKINAKAKAIENTVVLTTEKDYVRLKGSVKNLYYIEIHNEFIGSTDLFKNQILEFINQKKKESVN